MLYLHFLNNLSVEINKPITSQLTQSPGCKRFDFEKNCVGTSGRQRRAH